MDMLRKSLLLFVLNLLDALLTLVWIRNHFATEGNGLMAYLLEIGDAPFLIVKIGIGVITVFVLTRWGHFSVARYGVGLALGIYGALMLVHAYTGLAALGYEPDAVLSFFDSLTGKVLTFII
jgi:hypothetical protein